MLRGEYNTPQPKVKRRGGAAQDRARAEAPRPMKHPKTGASFRPISV